MYVSYISLKKFLIPSSFLLSWTMMNLIWLAVMKAETNHWLNLSMDFSCMLAVFHLCSSTKSRAAWAINWLRCLWSSFYGLERVSNSLAPSVCLHTRSSLFTVLNSFSKMGLSLWPTITK